MNARWLSVAMTSMVCLHSGLARSPSEIARGIDANCAFHFESPLPNQIVRASIHELAGDLREVSLDVNLELSGDSAGGNLLLLCPAAGASSATVPQGADGEVDRLSSPAEIIEREDAAGRYYRHVAWQRPIEGANWTGKVAYSDFAFGDGQKARVDYLLLCHSTVPAPCVEYTGNPGSQLSPAGMESLLDLLRALRFRRP